MPIRHIIGFNGSRRSQHVGVSAAIGSHSFLRLVFYTLSKICFALSCVSSYALQPVLYNLEDAAPERPSNSRPRKQVTRLQCHRRNDLWLPRGRHEDRSHVAILKSQVSLERPSRIFPRDRGKLLWPRPTARDGLLNHDGNPFDPKMRHSRCRFYI